MTRRGPHGGHRAECLHESSGQPDHLLIAAAPSDECVHGVYDSRLAAMIHANRGFHGVASARRLIVFNILRLITKPTGSIR
jgi:hypothetical protein